MTNQNHEQSEFDRYLQGGSALSSVYQRHDTDGPAELTDARILAAARAASGKQSGSSPFGGYRHMVPSSIAALFILTITAILIVDQFPSAPPQPAPVLAGNPESQRADQNSMLAGHATLNKPVTTNTVPPSSAPLELARADSRTRAESPAVAASPAPLAESAQVLHKDRANNYADSATRADNKPEKAELRKAKELAAIEESKAKRMADKRVAAKARSADDWLIEIATLIKNQQIKQARLELQAFRKNNPQHVIDAKQFPDIIRLLAELEPANPSR